MLVLAGGGLLCYVNTTTSTASFLTNLLNVFHQLVTIPIFQAEFQTNIVHASISSGLFSLLLCLDPLILCCFSDTGGMTTPLLMLLLSWEKAVSKHIMDDFLLPLKFWNPIATSKRKNKIARRIKEASQAHFSGQTYRWRFLLLMHFLFFLLFSFSIALIISLYKAIVYTLCVPWSIMTFPFPNWM